YQNLYYQTKIANISKEEGTRLGWRTTHASKPAIIGFLKNAIENDEIWIPSRTLISELLTFIRKEDGKLEAVPGSYDDTVIATAIDLELLRTHGDRLSVNRIPCSDRSILGYNSPQETTTWL